MKRMTTRRPLSSFSPSLMHVLIGFLLLSAVSRLPSATAQCTPCFNATEPTNPEGLTASKVRCDLLIDNIGFALPDSEFCENTQLETFQGCGCPAYDESLFCAMCDDNFFDIEARPKTVPLFSTEDLNCGELLFVRRSSELCEDTPRAAFHCGCPGAPAPICSFCPAGHAPARSASVLPPYYNTTCGDLRALAPFSLTNESCAALTADLPIATEFYCGCDPIDTAPGTCSLCGNNTTMEAPAAVVPIGTAGATMTCAQVGFLAETATDSVFCNELADIYYEPCCLGIFPTMTLTAAPDSPNVTATESPTITITASPTTSAAAPVMLWACDRIAFLVLSFAFGVYLW